MRKYIAVFVLILALGVAGRGWTDVLNREPGDSTARVMLKDIPLPAFLAPPETEVKRDFEKGPGDCIGHIGCIKGHRCLIYRKYSKSAFHARPGTPLYTGDVLITGERSRIKAELIGRASTVLEPDTWLEFNEIQYDKELDQRKIYLFLDFGRAKFVVEKLKCSREGDFQVHTPTGAISNKTKKCEFMVRVLSRSQHTAGLKKTPSLLQRLFSPREARAETVLQDPLVTVLLSGARSQLYFYGAEGPEVLLWENMVSFAIQGFAATRAKPVRPELVKEIMTCHCD